MIYDAWVYLVPPVVGTDSSHAQCEQGTSGWQPTPSPWKALMMAEHVQTERLVAIPAEAPQVDDLVRPYVKPMLTPLGRWALFTRAPSSEVEEDGFFQFGL